VYEKREISHNKEEDDDDDDEGHDEL